VTAFRPRCIKVGRTTNKSRLTNMDSLAAHAQAAVSGQNDQKGTFAVKVCPAASARTR
jgi:hypothetical protein